MMLRLCFGRSFFTLGVRVYVLIKSSVELLCLQKLGLRKQFTYMHHSLKERHLTLRNQHIMWVKYSMLLMPSFLHSSISKHLCIRFVYGNSALLKQRISVKWPSQCWTSTSRKASFLLQDEGFRRLIWRSFPPILAQKRRRGYMSRTTLVAQRRWEELCNSTSSHAPCHRFLGYYHVSWAVVEVLGLVGEYTVNYAAITRGSSP